MCAASTSRLQNAVSECIGLPCDTSFSGPGGSLDIWAFSSFFLGGRDGPQDWQCWPASLLFAIVSLMLLMRIYSQECGRPHTHNPITPGAEAGGVTEFYYRFKMRIYLE